LYPNVDRVLCWVWYAVTAESYLWTVASKTNEGSKSKSAALTPYSQCRQTQQGSYSLFIEEKPQGVGKCVVLQGK
jgi:hypothetical protein